MRALYDPQPGATGFLRGEDTVCLLPFDDREASNAPIDATGNLHHIAADAANGLGNPSIALDGFTGPARRFGRLERLPGRGSVSGNLSAAVGNYPGDRPLGSPGPARRGYAGRDRVARSR